MCYVPSPAGPVWKDHSSGLDYVCLTFLKRLLYMWVIGRPSTSVSLIFASLRQGDSLLECECRFVHAVCLLTGCWAVTMWCGQSCPRVAAGPVATGCVLACCFRPQGTVCTGWIACWRARCGCMFVHAGYILVLCRCWVQFGSVARVVRDEADIAFPLCCHVSTWQSLPRCLVGCYSGIWRMWIYSYAQGCMFACQPGMHPACLAGTVWMCMGWHVCLVECFLVVLWSGVVGFSFQALAQAVAMCMSARRVCVGEGGGEGGRGLGQQPVTHTDQVLAIVFRCFCLRKKNVRLQYSVSAMDFRLCPCAGFGWYGPADMALAGMVLYPRVAVAITYAYSGTPPTTDNMFIPSIIARKCGPSTQPSDHPKKHSGALIAAYM